jgi:hypothetical protein
MPKPAPQSPERLALAQAIEQRSAAQAALAEARAARDMASSDHAGVAATIYEIEARIRDLRGTRTHGVPQLLSNVNDKLSESFAALDAARAAAMPFSVAMEQAQSRVEVAQSPVFTADMRIPEAAAAVVRAEATPAASASLERLQDALATILEHGPDLLALCDRKLIDPAVAREIENTAGGLLRKALGGWPAYDARYRQSPWRGALAALEQDPAAPLPQAPAS